MRHLRAIFYFKQGIFYKFYPQENIIRQPYKQHPSVGRNFEKLKQYQKVIKLTKVIDCMK